MDFKELKQIVARGEDSHHQFKENITNGDQLAAEMVAFSNVEGGRLFFGVDKKNHIKGVFQKDVERINQLISNTASQHVRSPITVHTQNISTEKGRIVIILSIPKGIDKPYFDKNGVIWFRNGSDKRRINSKAELCRLFQSVGQFHADELSTKGSIEVLDKSRLKRFVEKVYNYPLPESTDELTKLLSNMNLLSETGTLNLAGLLLFAKRPEWIKPVFTIKAVSYPSSSIAVEDYIDSEDFAGPMEEIFHGALTFITRNLHKVQDDQNINSLGKLEISKVVFEELLVNALIHRDYFVSAPIRIFVFTDRIEIISPGHLPNNLTIEKIKTGNSNIRNPILASFIAKGLLPYRGLGSGIKRALKEWSAIDFVEDKEGCLFIAKVHRKSSPKTIKSSPEIAKSSPKTIKSSPDLEKSSQKILTLMLDNPEITIDEISKQIGIGIRAIKKQINNLKNDKLIQRVGPNKGGYWKVMSSSAKKRNAKKNDET